MSEIEGPRRRERLVVRWNDRVKKYMYERGADGERKGVNKQGGSVWIGRGRGSSAIANPLTQRE